MSQSLAPTFMSFCTQGLPGVAESTVSISEGKFSPSGKDTRQTDEGWEKVIFSGPHPPSSATVPPLPEGEGYLLDDGFCDFAFGFAQNDSVGGMPVRV
ncbi:MAG: hypothetical protein VXA33_18080 [Deltaproteobacteria bacterium]